MTVSARRVLVIKLSSLGDIVHTLPAVAALRKQFPSSQLYWLVKSEWASILEGNPNIDEVLSVDISWKNWPRLISRLRQLRCDLVVDFQGLFRTGLLGILSGARRRIGFSQAREGAAWMYTHRVSIPGDQGVPWRLLAVHAVDRNLSIVNDLGADITCPTFHLPGLEEDQTYIHDVLSGADIKSHEHVIALAPWSRMAIKAWPLARFVEVAKVLLERPSVRVVLLGGPLEESFASEFASLESQGLVNLVGKLSLRQLPVLLRRVKLVVGNDSSLIHLAAGVGTRVLAIFGPTHPKATGPYPLNRHSVLCTSLPCSPCGKRSCRNVRYLECLETIQLKTVVAEIVNKL